MSRSKKGSKGPGYEYWGRRPSNKFGGIAGPATKKYTHRVERRQGKDEAKPEVPLAPGDEAMEDICPGCPRCICRKCGGHVATGIEELEAENPVFRCIYCGYAPPEANQGQDLS